MLGKTRIHDGGYEVVFSKEASRFCIRKDYTGTTKKVYSLIGSVKTGDIYER